MLIQGYGLISEPTGLYLEFPDSKMWPYSHIFHTENTKYDDKIGERGSAWFPFPPIWGMSEIFLATSQIIIGCAKRKNIFLQEKKCIDLIQTATMHKQRLELESLELLYNSKIQDQEVLCVHFTQKWKKYLKVFDLATLKCLSQKEVSIMVKFKTIIEGQETKNLEFYKNYPYYGNRHLNGYYALSSAPIDEQRNPYSFAPYECSWQLVEYAKQFMDFYEYDSAFRFSRFSFTPEKEYIDPQTIDFRIRGYLDYHELLRMGKLHNVVYSDFKISRIQGVKIFSCPHFTLRVEESASQKK